MTPPTVISWLERHVPRSAHLCLDSRQIRRGDVFFACRGFGGDGRDYIAHALEQGAAAVVVHVDGHAAVQDVVAVPTLEVEGLQGLLGLIANQWYGEPSRALTVVAVTGTNGKTTSVHWLAAALNAGGVPCGTIGTLGVRLPDGADLGGMLTTPDVLTMHRSLAAIRDAGATVAALEASSIGLEQGRLDCVSIHIAAFTNLTHDHLDYHGTVENYKAAKLKLFTWPGLHTIVINADDPAGAELLAMPSSSATTLGYSLVDAPRAQIQARDVHTGPDGLIFRLSSPRGTAQLLTRLVGQHNISNLLLVAGVLQGLDWPISKTARILATLSSVDGRLQIVEPIAANQGSNSYPLVVVDYAHSPDALERALSALRDVVDVRRGKLICVFGCGGNRDKSKRPIMGRIAAERADHVVLTNDNPRMEDPQSIANQILAGMPREVHVELDRAQAILGAIWHADARDVVLLAGKGHETYQEWRAERLPFDDREWARFALTWLRSGRVSIDSRKIQAGEIFVAIKGDSFDGHDYLAQVQAGGACAAVVSKRNADLDFPQFVLGDTRTALIQIARGWRRLFHLPVIGVTGSNGKTTTKEMIASILVAWRGVDGSLATQGNLNNDLGVPLSVLRLTARHQAAVLELGMNHPGEIALLSGIAQPTIGIVNNAQREHQEFMHTVEAVARENGSVLEALPCDGVAVFPGDDVFTELWTGLAAHRDVLSFGFTAACAVWADHIHAEPTRTHCQLHTPAGTANLVLSAPGVHNLRNALAATAGALAAGAPLSAIIQGLQAFNPVAGRMQPKVMVNGYQLIDDSYNANPDSVRAAIDVLAQLEGTTILVLGDMAEVGNDRDAVHLEVGAYARERGIDALLTCGEAASFAAQAFGEPALAFESVETLTSHLLKLMPAHILVKGSRSTRMERVVVALEKQLEGQKEGAGNAS